MARDTGRRDIGELRVGRAEVDREVHRSPADDCALKRPVLALDRRHPIGARVARPCSTCRKRTACGLPGASTRRRTFIGSLPAAVSSICCSFLFTAVKAAFSGSSAVTNNHYPSAHIGGMTLMVGSYSIICTVFDLMPPASPAISCLDGQAALDAHPQLDRADDFAGHAQVGGRGICVNTPCSPFTASVPRALASLIVMPSCSAVRAWKADSRATFPAPATPPTCRPA